MKSYARGNRLGGSILQTIKKCLCSHGSKTPKSTSLFLLWRISTENIVAILMLASQPVDTHICVAVAHIQRMSCWHYYHLCRSVTGLSSWSDCARLPWSMQSTFWQGHRQEKLNQAACRQIPKWSQNWSRILSHWSATLPLLTTCFSLFTGPLSPNVARKVGCDTRAGSDDLAFIPVFGLHRHNFTWLGATICDTRCLKSKAERGASTDETQQCLSVKIYQHTLSPYYTVDP